jgi:hypothetical protein
VRLGAIVLRLDDNDLHQDPVSDSGCFEPF